MIICASYPADNQNRSGNRHHFFFGLFHIRPIVTAFQHKTAVLCCSKH